MFAIMKRVPPVSTPAVTFVAQYFAFSDLMSKKTVMPLCRSAESTAIYPNDIKSGSISGSQPFIPFIHIKSALYSIGCLLLCAISCKCIKIHPDVFVLSPVYSVKLPCRKIYFALRTISQIKRYICKTYTLYINI